MKHIRSGTLGGPNDPEVQYALKVLLLNETRCLALPRQSWILVIIVIMVSCQKQGELIDRVREVVILGPHTLAIH